MQASRNFLEKQHGVTSPEIHSSVLEGIKRVCYSKHSFLVPLYTVLAFRHNVPCKIVVLQEETSLFIPHGMVIVKNSPYKGLFNYK